MLGVLYLRGIPYGPQSRGTLKAPAVRVPVCVRSVHSEITMHVYKHTRTR